jgi:hypothetical protein
VLAFLRKGVHRHALWTPHVLRVHRKQRERAGDEKEGEADCDVDSFVARALHDTQASGPAARSDPGAGAVKVAEKRPGKKNKPVRSKLSPRSQIRALTNVERAGLSLTAGPQRSDKVRLRRSEELTVFLRA